MDLIVTNADGEDIEVVKGFDLDLAYGSDENDFELKQKIGDEELYQANYRLYIDGTEYGGIIDDITIDTESEEVTYHGRTWHGILNSKIICPEEGEDYRTVSGDLVAWTRDWIEEVGLDSLFTLPIQTEREVTYSFDRYCTAYVGGLLKVLTRNDLKMVLKYHDAKVDIYLLPMTTYSDTEEWSADKIELKMSHDYNKVNHLICLGQGNLADRQRIDLYADADGNISQTQTFTGLDEVTEIYDYSNVESEEKLLSDGIEELKSRRGEDTIETSMVDTDVEYDIGDKISEQESLSGLYVTEKITKKIVSLDDNEKSVDYEIGGGKVTSSKQSTDNTVTKAVDVEYSNTESGLSATNVNDAIDELNTDLSNYLQIYNRSIKSFRIGNTNKTIRYIQFAGFSENESVSILFHNRYSVELLLLHMGKTAVSSFEQSTIVGSKRTVSIYGTGISITTGSWSACTGFVFSPHFPSLSFTISEA